MRAALRSRLAAGAAPPGPVTITHVGGSTSSGTSTSRTIAQPAGIAAGDVGIIYALYGSQPTGWTPSAGGFYKVYGAGEGSVAVPSYDGGSHNMTVALAVFRRVNNSSPMDAASTGRTTASGTSYPSYAATAVHDRTMLVSMVYMAQSSGSSTPTFASPPSGLTMSAQASMAKSNASIAYGAGPLAGADSAAPTWTCNLSTISAGVNNVLLRPSDT